MGDITQPTQHPLPEPERHPVPKNTCYLPVRGDDWDIFRSADVGRSKVTEKALFRSAGEAGRQQGWRAATGASAAGVSAAVGYVRVWYVGMAASR